MLFPYIPIVGQSLTLVPFEDEHIEGLKKIAFDKSIWENLPYKINSENDFADYINNLKDEIDKGIRYPFTIIENQSGEILGSTGFKFIDEVNKKLEIGTTWLATKTWGTKVNLESKYLLLNFCFTDNDVMRIEIKTREANIRSQKAIEKIGGFKEGILRCDQINEDGTFRNSFLYSIIKPDWQALKPRLLAELAQH
jgi:RimJ/RimL family protein N-acetyltransferase